MADDGQVQQPLNPDLMGYPTVEALVAAKRASDAEGKRLFDENTKKDALIAQVLTNGLPNGRQNVPDRRTSSPEERLTEFGVPTDALDAYVGERINRAFAPITNGMQARGRVVSSHPDYVQFENDVASFIASDPELSVSYPKLFEAAPKEAIEYAFLKFGDSRRRTSPPPGNGVVGNSAEAAIPSSRGGESRRAPDGSQELQTAFEQFQKTGSSRDAQAYAKLRLRSVIKDDFLNQ
jgi:hypothetical protein